MNIKIFFLLLLIGGCGQKPVQNMLMPADQATPEERAILTDALEKIQTDFYDNGVNVDIRTIPYHVSTILPSNIAGICVYKENGEPAGIAINRRVMQEWMIESAEAYGFIYKSLLHEIGHCFFQREHDDAHLELPENILSERLIDLSVMVNGGQPNTLKILWPYYVREVAGLDRINCLEDLENFLNNSNP